MYQHAVQFEKITVRNFCSSAQPAKSFNIKFLTPAYFNTLMGDYPVRFPIPSLFFGNLANLWNSITEDEGEINRDTFINWVNAHVYVSYYKMKTVRRDINKPRPVYGGIGDAAFRVKKVNKNYYSHYLEELGRGEEDSDFLKKDYVNNCKWLDALCHFGEYTNVGANRTAGMGVIRYYPKMYLNAEALLSK